jgi:hypothetical protein
MTQLGPAVIILVFVVAVAIFWFIDRTKPRGS